MVISGFIAAMMTDEELDEILNEYPDDDFDDEAFEIAMAKLDKEDEEEDE